MMAELLESGVLERGAKWGERDPRRWSQDVTYFLAARSPPPPGAHELERAFASAISEDPDKDPLHTASDVVSGGPCDQIDTPLTEAGLLYDESRRWHIAWFGWALFWIGLSWSGGRLIAYDAPADHLADWLFIVGTLLLLPGVFESQPDTEGQADATPNGRLVVECARERHKALRDSFSASDVRLAVALFGADTVRHDHAGVRDTYELLEERFNGLV